MNSFYEFHEKVILRTPRFPLLNQLDEQVIKELLGDEHFLEAIYLASPVLYDECLKWKDGEITNKKEIDKITRSLAKYYSRMTSRCTPFGLFSGCGVIEWGISDSKITVERGKIKRHTRFDMHWLCSLSQKIALIPEVRSKLLFFPNTSIYKIGNELRYVDYKYLNAKRNHQISSVEASAYIEKLLNAAQQGITTLQMIELIVDEEVTALESEDFVHELIQEQIFISELEPAITGDEFIFQIIKVLKKINGENDPKISNLIALLEAANYQLQQIDHLGRCDVTKYRALISLINALEVPFEENKLFQTDLVKSITDNQLSDRFQKELIEGLTVLNKLGTFKENANLQSFAKKFYERYEENEMPLLQVLDTETGIGYLDYGGNDIAPLINDLHISSPNATDQQLKWGRLENLLNAKLIKEKKYAIEIQEEELNGFSANWENLPPSLSVIFKLIRPENNQSSQLFLESATGSSAANLLGRFAHADPMIESVVKDITKKEQENDPDIIFAEIIHLPESRIGNILLHPSFRDFEIPFLSKSSLANDHQISLDDLYISVKNNEVILRSKRLGKQVMPRLSNAHNYSYNALPVYQLLCDLQHQGKRSSMSFSWGSLAVQHQFLPRVTYKGILLQPATWNFYEKDIQELIGKNENSREGVKNFCEKWAIPRYATIADGDNELLIDFENELSVNIFVESIKKRPGFMLKEFFHPDNVSITDENGSPYANQMVAVLTKKASSYAKVVAHFDSPIKSGLPVKQKFSIGSEWLYYKIYCGQKSADKILLEAIKPLTEALQEMGLIDKWFFIRYNDPDFHIRFRLHGVNEKDMGTIILKARQYLLPFEEEKFIWKLQMDTYNREIKRYGSNTIELAESLFHIDSETLLGMLDCTWGDERENIRWIWGMKAIDELLNNFHFSLLQKWDLLNYLRNAFATEFHMDKALKTQLNNKHRNHRQEMERFMNNHIPVEDEKYQLMQLLSVKSKKVIPLANAIVEKTKEPGFEISLSNLLGSYIHMLLNRISTSNPRLHELVIYDFLLRHYQTLLVMSKKPEPKKASAVAL